MEEFRSENEKLEGIVEQKKKETEELQTKVNVLHQDKEEYRQEIIRLTGKVEIVFEASLEESKEKDSTDLENKINTSQEEVEEIDNNDKKLQTVSCFK